MPNIDKVAYVSHPVSRELKADLNSQGYAVVDARFAPEGAEIMGDAENGAAAIPSTREEVESLSKEDLIDLIEAHGGSVDGRTSHANLVSMVQEIMFV